MKFIDLQEQYRLYRSEVLAEIEKVLDSAQFIMGPAVREAEAALAKHAGAKHAICCASGTDALLLGLMAKEVRPGDEILVPDFTFFATAEVVANVGATPVFVDVDPRTYNMDVSLIEKRITRHSRGIIPVSLYGQCADLDEVNKIARDHGIWVMEDAAQSYGASCDGRKSGTITEMAATSFYPAKPLGCYGDGGAIFTSDDKLDEVIRQLLNHGQSETYRHMRLGINGRMDTVQAAVLIVKLKHFDEEMPRKKRVASQYSDRLRGLVRVPHIKKGNESVWAQFTVASDRREAILTNLKSQGIPTAIHYPRPLHSQPVFAGMGARDEEYPVSVRSSREVFSLPMHPFLSDRDVDFVCNAIQEALK